MSIQMTKHNYMTLSRYRSVLILFLKHIFYKMFIVELKNQFITYIHKYTKKT